MIYAWLGKKALFGLARGIWVAIAAALVLIAILWLQAREAKDDAANQEIGATQQREVDLRETLGRTEQGNEVREQVEREADAGTGDSLYALCVRSNRGETANCQRFLPQREADNERR